MFAIAFADVRIRIRHAIAPLTSALVAWALGAAAPLAGQTPPAATIPAAMAKLRAGNADAAIAIMQTVVARDSNNSRAWRVLGAAEKQAGHFAPAITAYTRALTLDTSATAAVAMYGIGASYARSGNADSAFQWLGRAKSSHRLDLTGIDADTELVTLRNDARYTALRPVPADFADPIVEPVKIVREWDGESANDQFGWIARSIGDVDGDHVADFVTSAPTRSNGGASAGRVYVYSSRTGKLLWTVDGKPGETLGIGIEAAGDVNRDGVPDVIASAPGAGKAYVYSGRDGHVLLTFSAENAADGFGAHVAGNVDVNGDGYPDLLVGAPANSANGKGAGRAYIYSGKDGSLLLTLSGERAGDAFGSTVAGASDRAHGFTFMVGAPGAGDNHTGRTYVYHRAAAATVVCDRIRQHRRRTRRNVSLGPRRYGRRRSGRRLCFGLDQQRQGSGDGKDLRQLRCRRSPTLRPHWRESGRWLWHIVVGRR